MKSFSLALLLAAFTFGLSTGDVDARVHHFHKRNYIWHNGHHYKTHGHKHHKRHHHRKHHRPAPKAIVVAHVYVGTQHMTLDVNGTRYGDWAVSTGKSGYYTPRGAFHATRLERVYFSRKYDNSPMPNSVFFHGGNAIHGTYHVRSLGRPASHGCVRLLPAHAAELFELVNHYGMLHSKIIVSD